MHRAFRSILVAAGAVVPGLCGVLAAAAPPAPAPAASRPGTPDPLAAPATLQARGDYLDVFLRGLNTPGRLRFAAGRDAAWERVILFVKERPLRDVINGVSRLFDYTWERTSYQGQTRFTLVPALHARRYEQELLGQTLDAAAAPLTRLARLTSTPPSRFAEFKRSLKGRPAPDPLVRENLDALISPGHHALLAIVAGMSREQVRTLLENERFCLAWSAMSPRQRENARRVVPIFDLARGTPEGSKEDQRWLERFGLVLVTETHPVTGAVTGLQFSLGGPVHNCADFSERQPELDLLPVRGRPYRGERSADRTDYSALERAPFPSDFKLDPKRREWTDLLEKLSESLKMPVLSDEFTAMRIPSDRGAAGELNLEGKSVAAGLDLLCARYGRLWWLQNGMLFFRSRKWYLERLYEVPLPIATLIGEQLAASGRLDTRGVEALSRLTSRQLQGLNASAGFDRGGAYSGMRWDDLIQARGAHTYLRVYALLNEGQRQAVLSPRGLPAAGMLPAQRQAFLELVFIEQGRKALEDVGKLRLQIRQIPPAPSQKSRALHVVDLMINWTVEGSLPKQLQLVFRPRGPAGAPETALPTVPPPAGLPRTALPAAPNH